MAAAAGACSSGARRRPRRSQIAARARAGPTSSRRRRRRRRRCRAGAGVVEGLRHSHEPRRRGDPPPLRRLQRVLRDGPRPVDDLHLRVFPTEDATLEEAQDDKYDLVARKLGLQPGHAAARRRLRLGRHGPPRRPHYGVKALGVTLSREQADVGAGGDQARGARRPRRGAARRLPRRRRDRLRRGQLDRADRAHRRAQLPGVLRASCATSCVPGGRLLNHCITRPRQPATRRPARSSTATSSPTAS